MIFPTPDDPKVDHSFSAHTGAIQSIDFSPLLTSYTRCEYNHDYLNNNKTTRYQYDVLTGAADNVLMRWQLSPRINISKYIGHQSPVTCVRYSKDGLYFASSSEDSTIRIYENHSEREYKLDENDKEKDENHQHFSYSQNEKHHVSNEMSRRRTSCLILKCHNSNINSLSWSNYNHIFSTGSSDTNIKFWQLAQNGQHGDQLVGIYLQTLHAHMESVTAVEYSPDSRVLISASRDETVKVWDTGAGTGSVRNSSLSSPMTKSVPIPLSLYLHSSPVLTVNFHPFGSLISTGSMDGKIRLFDIRSNYLIHHYGVHSESVNSISFHPTGNYLLSASSDETIKIVDLRKGCLLYTLSGHDNGCAITSINHSKDGELFATGAQDQKLITWNWNQGLKPINTQTLNKGNNNSYIKQRKQLGSYQPQIHQRFLKDNNKQQNQQNSDALRHQDSTTKYFPNPLLSSTSSVLSLTATPSAVSFPLLREDVNLTPFTCSYTHSHIGNVNETEFSYDKLIKQEILTSHPHHNKMKNNGTKRNIKSHLSKPLDLPLTESSLYSPSPPSSIQQSEIDYNKYYRPIEEQLYPLGVMTAPRSKCLTGDFTSNRNVQSIPFSNGVGRLGEELAAPLSQIVTELADLTSSLIKLEEKLTQQENRAEKILIYR